jgi:hypothetical protein
MKDARLCPCVYRGVIPRPPECGEKPDDFEE